MKKIVQTVTYSSLIALLLVTPYAGYRAFQYEVAEKWKYDHRDQLAEIVENRKQSAASLCKTYHTLKKVAEEHPEKWSGFDWTVFKANCMEADMEP